MRNGGVQVLGQLSAPLVLAASAIEVEHCRLQRKHKERAEESISELTLARPVDQSGLGTCAKTQWHDKSRVFGWLTVMAQHRLSDRKGAGADQSEQLEESKLGRLDAFLPPAPLSKGGEQHQAALGRDGCSSRVDSSLRIALTEHVDAGGEGVRWRRGHGCCGCDCCSHARHHANRRRLHVHCCIERRREQG